MRIIVTGGAGYIGSVMTAMLAEAGNEVLVIDNLSRGHRRAVKDLPLAEIDLLDLPGLVGNMREFAPQAVMHFAALSRVEESIAEPMRYYQTNLSGGINLLQAMIESDCRMLIFSSSAAVYGVPESSPVKESDPTNPINPYGASKLTFEALLPWMQRAHGLNYIALRYFNAAGADLEHDLGEDHHPETKLIPRAVFAAMGKNESVEIYGTDYDTPDGTCIRDYIHVIDLCRAHVLALDALNEGRATGFFNLGNESGFSVREIIDAVKRVSGRDFTVISGKRRPGDPPVMVSSSLKAQESLGWQPSIDDIEEIVGTSWKWHNRHPEGYPE